MANKKSIQDIDADIVRWLRKLNMATRKLTELHELRRKIVTGKVRRPEPKGVKVMFSAAEPGLNDSLTDLLPSGYSGAGFGA